MRRRGAAGLLVLVAALAALFVARTFPADPRPQDRALPGGTAAATQALRVTVLGTSLTARYDWPARLGPALGGCLASPMQITVIAQAGAGSDWGLAQLAAVAATHPDIVLIEFAINDADLRDGQSLRDSAATHRRLIVALRQALPDARIALMTMSPAQGLRGWLRPRLAQYYALYRDLAAELDLGLVDLYPRWLALPPAARGLGADGLHPEAGVAAGVILPVLVPWLARAASGGAATGIDCPAAPEVGPGGPSRVQKTSPRR